MSHRIFIVEDNPLVRQGYVALIELEPGLEVCGHADDAGQALDTIADARPDLAIIDVLLPGLSGLRLVEQLREVHPALRMLVISGQDQSIYRKRALAAGALGYVDKKEAATDLIPTIHRLLSDGAPGSA